MGPIQLSFSLRTSPNCKTVHLVGNWDKYKGQLPLSKDTSKAGAWKGTFRFQGATLTQGQRYWYYYIMDGYHVSHDPGKPFTTEPTTKRNLNILDVPPPDPRTAKAQPTGANPSSGTGKANRRLSVNIPKGRPISPSRIVSPRPMKPGSAVDALTRHIAATQISESDSSSESEFEGSDGGSDVPSLSSSRSSNSSPGTGCSSPGSDLSTGSHCSCNRFGITRKGNRVRLDCGGLRCGYSESDCSDSDTDSAGYNERATRRQGVVIRHPT